ncbi:MAG: AbrB/MazE/SpoVT family DNA-binding domain-containing protein [Candidatus Aenigmarchaeota archaeon]|nr:AbrB/MazE/SpoVT family DNA-binding domain-containing protein [Candidatus Aenigmarchaeota archaeon]
MKHKSNIKSRARNRNNDIYYGSTKVGSRGQVVLPIELRKKLKIEEGEILFVCEDGKSVKIMKSEILKKVLKRV